MEEFYIYRQTVGETDLELLVTLPGNQRHYNDKAVQPGKTYIYSIYAVYQHGHSEAVSVRITFKEPPQPPPQPQYFEAEHSGNKIILRWQYPVGVEIDHFIITKIVDGTIVDNITRPPHRREYEDNAIDKPGTYKYRIVAVKDNIHSEAVETTEINISNGEETGAAGTGSFLWSLISRALPQRLAFWVY